MTLLRSSLVSIVGVVALTLFAAITGMAVVTGRSGPLALTLMVLLLISVIGLTLTSWRSGTMLFFLWLLFEDLPRKFLGNNMLVYFGKDLLVALVYVSFLLDARARRERIPAFSFRVPLLAFVALGVVQVFNPASPSLLYGLLGLKVYFFYIPLVVIGYSLVRSESDLRAILLEFAIVAAIIALLGIVQGIVGLDFLNPTVLAPELEALGREVRRSSLSGALVPRATSIFVSEGRQGSFMMLAFLITFGGAAYFHVQRARGASIVFGASIITFVALMLHGSRAGFLLGLLSLGVLSSTYVLSGGTPDARHRLQAFVWATPILACVLGGAIYALFPSSVMARWALYAESLTPGSTTSELWWRLWEYPTLNFRGALESGHALLGQGIGTASLGVQYVQRLFGTAPPPPPVESGYGTLLLELGILGPLLWVIWSGTLVYASWICVRKLRGTPLFPVAAAFTWFFMLLMFPLTYGALNAYQNYLYNAFFWVMVGMLHKLAADVPEDVSGKQ